MKMNRLLAALPAGLLAAFLGAATSQVQAAGTFSEAFTQGDLGISFRYRFEHVDQVIFADARSGVGEGHSRRDPVL